MNGLHSTNLGTCKLILWWPKKHILWRSKEKERIESNVMVVPFVGWRVNFGFGGVIVMQHDCFALLPLKESKVWKG